jgi:hypothetical protein
MFEKVLFYDIKLFESCLGFIEYFSLKIFWILIFMENFLVHDKYYINIK